MVIQDERPFKKKKLSAFVLYFALMHYAIFAFIQGTTDLIIFWKFQIPRKLQFFWLRIAF